MSGVVDGEKKRVVKRVVKKVVKSVENNIHKKWITKVIKSEEFEDKTWFLSGLWFSSNKKSPEDILKEKEDKGSVATSADFDVIKEQVESQKKERQWTSTNRPSFGDFNRASKWFVGQKKSTTYKKSIHNRHIGNKPKITKIVSVQKTQTIIKKKKVSTTSKTLVKKTEMLLSGSITVKEFSEKMWVTLVELMKVLLKNKIMVWINSSLDFDVACLIWEEFGVSVKKPEANLDVESFLEWDLQAILKLDQKKKKKLLERPPIVTVMGHVDHGKTTLLDYLRKTSIAGGEAGWITQSIGASVVDYNGQKITFIDTPWHELFTSLRARWAKLTNVAIIVVAADDGLMPQTVESINHAKAAWVPIIIAVTKIDKSGITIDQIKTDITQHWLTPEDWGWDVPVIWVSGITWEGIPELLEAVLLQSEMLELKFNPKRSAVWVVLDAYKDPKKWVVTSIILMTWTLEVRNITVAYNTYGKIKRMWDWKWNDVARAVGWEPVQVLGFTEIPEPGRIVEVVNNEKIAINKVWLIKALQDVDGDWWSAVKQFLAQLQQWWWEEIAILNLVLKSDGSSSLEALNQAVNGMVMPENVDIKIIHSSIWPFSDSDLSLSQASKALLVGFNLPITNNIKKKSQANGVDVKSFDIIYELTDYLEQIVLGMVKIEQVETVLWKLEVLWVFFRKWKEMVIWWKVIEGVAENKVRFKVLRDDDVFVNGKITSLQKDKNNVKEVSIWHECGMKVKVWKKIEVWDVLEFWDMRDKV